jgi:hypothetical protein
VKHVFADTLYWIAIFLPGDPWASTARAVELSGASLVTTEEVLSEFLTAVSAQAERTRRLAHRVCCKTRAIVAQVAAGGECGDAGEASEREKRRMNAPTRK